MELLQGPGHVLGILSTVAIAIQFRCSGRFWSNCASQRANDESSFFNPNEVLAVGRHSVHGVGDSW